MSNWGAVVAVLIILFAAVGVHSIRAPRKPVTSDSQTTDE